MPTLHRFKLPITTEQDLRDFICYAHGVKLPDVQVCPNHTTPWRAFADAYFAKSPIAVWKASRGLGGKTYLLSLLSLVEAETLKCNVSLLGGSGEQSKRALETLTGFFEYPNAPKYLLESDVARETRLAYGNHVEALMASQASVRGPHPARLRADEIDEMDLAILDSALGQPMSQGDVLSQVVQSSTHQYADGTMSTVLKRAAEDGHPIYEWCYRETLQPHGWLSEQEKERKKAQMTKTSWENEVELQEPNPESRAIDPVTVRRMFKRELGEFAGEVRQYIEIEEPQSDAEYFTGADWAKEQHYTIIITFKKGDIKTHDDGKREVIRPHRLVAFERLGRENWNSMIDRYQIRLERFNGPGNHDITGIGNVIEDQITVTGSEGFDFRNSKERARMLNDYCVAIENGEYESPFIHYMESEHRTASNNDVYGTGHLPDTVSSGALANRAAHHGRLQVYL